MSVDEAVGYALETVRSGAARNSAFTNERELNLWTAAQRVVNFWSTNHGKETQTMAKRLAP